MFPDVAALVLSWLRPRLGVPATMTVPSSRPGSFVTVQRTGGPRANLVTDGAQITVDSWAASPADAQDLAQRARAHLHAAVGQMVDGTPLYRVVEYSGPAWMPDPESAHARYRQTFAVYVRGAAVA